MSLRCDEPKIKQQQKKKKLKHNKPINSEFMRKKYLLRKQHVFNIDISTVLACKNSKVAQPRVLRNFSFLRFLLLTSHNSQTTLFLLVERE